MKRKFLASMVALCMVVSFLAVPALAVDYTDTEGHWAEDEIARWSDAGVVNGVAPGEFNPNGLMTRAEAAQVFTNLLKLTETADISSYTDVDADAWYADAIAACVAKGILNGQGDGLMNPTGNITREMFFVMFVRALGIPEADTLEKTFEDSDSISGWARGAVYALANKGYVRGVSETSIAPSLYIDRASVMALLDQTIVAYVVEDGAVTVNEDGVVLVLADNVTLSGSGDVTVSIASEGADVDLDDMTGEVGVVVLADGVAVANAPAGAVVTVADGVTGTTVNGDAVSAGEEVTIPESTTGGGGGGGGGNPSVDPGGDEGTDDPEEEQPVNPGGDDPEEEEPVNPGGDDPEEEEPVNPGGDDPEEEQPVNPGDDPEEQDPPEFDDDEEEKPVDDEEEEAGGVQGGGAGSDEMDPVA